MATVGSDYTYRYGAQAETRVAVSTKNKVYSFVPGSDNKFQQIGLMGSFGLSESRTIDPVRGIGYGDQIAELVPGVTEPMSISVERSMLYLAQLMQIFGYNAGIDGIVRSLKHHRWPFDIMQELAFSQVASANTSGSNIVQPASDGQNKALFTIYEACWFTSYNTTFAADTTIVTESCDISVSDIYDARASGYGENLVSCLPLLSRRFTAVGNQVP